MSVRSTLPPSSSSGGDNMYSLKWNHYHSYLTKGLAQLLNDEFSMTDVTLACEGQFIQAHKVALAVCSPFFKEYFKTYRMDKSGGLIVLTNVRFKDLKNLITFIYQGEVNVSNADLNSFLRTANDLKIEGLVDTPGNENGSSEQKLESKPSTPAVTQSISGSRLPPSNTSIAGSSSSVGTPPPIKRSRLSSAISGQTSSPTIPVQTSIVISASSSKPSELSASPIIINTKPTAAPAPPQPEAPSNYDPLEMEDEEEEMISFDEVKPEPIAVYTLNDEDSLDHQGDHLGGDASLGNESSGIVYHDYESSLSQQSGAGPSSSSLQSHHRVQPGTAPRPANKSTAPVAEKESVESSGSKCPEFIDTFQMKCKKCGESLKADQFQSHGCVNSPNVPTGTVEPVICPHCKKTFKNKNSLKVHKSTYHRPANVSKVSSGTRLNSLVDLDYTSTPTPPPKAEQTAIGTLVTNVAELVQVKIENPQTPLAPSLSKPTPIQLAFPSQVVVLPDQKAVSSQGQQLLHALRPTPVFFGDLEEYDTSSASVTSPDADHDTKPDIFKRNL